MTTSISVRSPAFEAHVDPGNPGFLFSASSKPEEEASPGNDAVGMIRRKQCRVLVVDDGDLFRDSLVFKLQNLYGARVEGARGGMEALKRAEGGGFHLILLDVAMPDMNGVDVCKTLLAREVEARIVLMSAYYDTENQEKARGMGITLLHKPLDDNALEGILLGCAGDRNS